MLDFIPHQLLIYLELLKSDLITAWFVNCHFNETNFPTLGGGIKKLEQEIT